ncbi:MAG TPA: hypothetical protein VEY11_13995 [Pyrinomonadaceae bacterium]|nr:hypothetical protein [Pyrinomonadaceae bacterium]
MLTKDLYIHFSNFTATGQTSLHVVAPYIRVEALNAILANVQLQNVTIVTTWKTADVLNGASDLDLYPYLRSRNWYLYLHPSLHAKLIVTDLSNAIITSANITKSALGLAAKCNVECAEYVESLSSSDRLWLLGLVAESLLVQDEYYFNFSRHVDSQRPNLSQDSVEEFDRSAFVERQWFLLSSLPMSYTPETLLTCLEVISKGEEAKLDPTDLTCALHDATLFSLDSAATRDENERRLRENFFAHPFIHAFADYVHPRKFFGETKAWIQNNCTNVPVPRRRDLTGHVRVLFDWFVALGRGEYLIERPNYSECLVHLGKTK